VTSLAGEPATLQVSGPDELVAAGQRRLARNTWRLALAKGQSLLVMPRGRRVGECTAAPVTAQPGRANAFGLP
jgi:hypothetical protein